MNSGFKNIKCGRVLISGLRGGFPDHFRAVKVFAGIPFSCCYLHGRSLQFSHYSLCLINVFALAGFVAATKQEDNRCIIDDVVSTVPGAEKETQFKQTTAKAFVVPQITHLNMIKTFDYPVSAWD